MAELLDDMIALEAAARRCIPRLAADPVIIKCEIPVENIHLVDVEFHNSTRHKVVVLEPSGPLAGYISEILRELLAEEGIDAWAEFRS